MIIGISGKKGVGKDTVATIIQYLIDQSGPYYLGDKEYEYSYEELEKELITLLEEDDKLEYPDETGWKNVKFADKLKDMVCLLLGCTREQLEDPKFKESTLGEEWVRYAFADGFFQSSKGTVMNSKPCSKERYEEELGINWQTAYKLEHTPRTILQLLGTECGREIIHPNIWVNATMADYTEHSNWIISDVRFPNEAKAIKDKKGVLIRVERDLSTNNVVSEHESETALDTYTNWDYIIDNNISFKELIYKVKEILIKENLYERNN